KPIMAPHVQGEGPLERRDYFLQAIRSSCCMIQSACRQPAMPNSSLSPGAQLRAAVDAERPLQVAGAINAYCAMLAERAGFRALYLSGAGVANASRGLPDLGMTTLDDVLTDIRRIVAATSLPLLVDADTGWEDPAQTVRAMTA